MKKIMFVLAAVATAISVQAASMNWKFTGSSDVKGLEVYAFTTALDVKSEADITASTSHGALPASGRNFAVQGKLDGYSEAGVTSDIYFYILDKDSAGDMWYYTATASGATYDASSTDIPQTVSFSNTKIGAVGTEGWTKISGSTPPGPGPDPVPEPTSGLLLVLGGAALALRRKQK